ncbi:MAG: MFS transporter [Acidimicrobiales bacterium]|nr:MFS transporter [Acidimicrobiales bacterium]
MTSSAATPTTPATPPASGVAAAFASLRAPHFPKVWAAGWIWSIARWGMGFLGAYVVNDLTGSPRLVQLTGTFMWGPLLFAGLVGGAVSDRVDRRRAVLVQLGVMIPLTVLIGVAALGDQLRVWMIYPFLLVVGFGWIVDMTVRRAMIYDLVGEEHVNGAMALEMLSSSAGLAMGALIGGTVIGALGIGQAYLVIAGGLLAALAVMWRVPAVARSAPPPAAREPFLRSVADGFRALPSNPALVSILGVTVFVDFFHFSFFPIVPLIAERLEVSAALTGLLSASSGFGMMAGSLWVAARRPHRGRAYVVGSMAACTLLLGFATAGRYGVALLFALGGGVAMGLFGSTQTALAITATSAELRGRAMGLLSMAIGALPIGMYALGELAQAVGPRTALVIFNLVGLGGLAVWVKVRPEVLRTR